MPFPNEPVLVIVWLALALLVTGAGIYLSRRQPGEASVAEPSIKEDPTQLSGAILMRRYRLTRLIAGGVHGVVYEGIDLKTSLTIAVKVPRNNVAVGFLAREELLLRLCSFPGIPKIHAYYPSHGGYLILDFIEGETLEHVLHRRSCTGGLSLADVLEIIMQVCMILDHLHTKQPPLVYRDLKPAHVLWTSDGSISLVDYSITTPEIPRTSPDPEIWVTEGYAAPEQYQGIAEPASDIYALGVLTYQLLTGIAPARGKGEWVPPYQRPLSRISNVRLYKLVMQMLQVDLDFRPKSAAEVHRALQRVAAQERGV